MARPAGARTTRTETLSPSPSNINIQALQEEHDSDSVRSSSSTMPTSISESSTKEEDDIRSTRKRKSINYNESVLSDRVNSRNVSGLTGSTLVEEDQRSTKKRKIFPTELPPRVQRRTSVKDKVKNVAARLTSALGKRGREMKFLKELDMGPKGLLDEIDLDIDDEPPRPTKKLKKSEAQVAAAIKVEIPTKTATIKRKKWLSSGLYAGQSQDEKPKQAKLQKRSVETEQSRPSALPLPMFGYLDYTRDFTIPFDVFAPTFKKGDDKPKDWHQLNRNRLIGEAREIWEKDVHTAISLCICRPPPAGEQGCDDGCLNRAMHYECDDTNCGLSAPQCSNRAFAKLASRVKKGGAFDIGVEVVKTPNRGFGVRACRAFEPGSIIMEYTGEIISEAECQRRMREVYAGKQSYYIMEFDQGLHIDGTKGSMARFVNHSCEPNCEVRMVKVAGIPRMAIFAGEDGVFTGQELTYDYNFDNFGSTKQACYCGAPSCRGHLARRLNATEQKQKDKEDREQQRLAELEAKKRAAREETKKMEKAGRGSGWRGWVTVGEIKDELKQARAARVEAEKNSARAKRLAARRDEDLVRTKDKKITKTQAKQRKSTTTVTVVHEENTTQLAGAVGFSNASEDLPRDDEIVTAVEVTTMVRETIKSLDDYPKDSAKDKSLKVLKTVEKAVRQGYSSSKAKLMRQSTITFTKA